MPETVATEGSSNAREWKRNWARDYEKKNKENERKKRKVGIPSLQIRVLVKVIFEILEKWRVVFYFLNWSNDK